MSFGFGHGLPFNGSLIVVGGGGGGGGGGGDGDGSALSDTNIDFNINVAGDYFTAPATTDDSLDFDL